MNRFVAWLMFVIWLIGMTAISYGAQADNFAAVTLGLGAAMFGVGFPFGWFVQQQYERFKSRR